MMRILNWILSFLSLIAILTHSLFKKNNFFFTASHCPHDDDNSRFFLLLFYLKKYTWEEAEKHLSTRQCDEFYGFSLFIHFSLINLERVKNRLNFFFCLNLHKTHKKKRVKKKEKVSLPKHKKTRVKCKKRNIYTFNVRILWTST